MGGHHAGVQRQRLAVLAQLDVQQRQDVTVLTPQGKITIGVGDVALKLDHGKVKSVELDSGVGEVALLIDNGGTSMLPHVDLTRLLFAKLRDRIKRLHTYFFHNTIYARVYKDPQRRQPVPTPKLLTRGVCTRWSAACQRTS